MSSPLIYLDHAATTPLDPAVLEAMLPFLREEHGNPSSPHAAGRTARNAVDISRERIAAALGAEPREIVFTSGGSEADNLAIRGVLDRRDNAGCHIVTTAIEHEAVLTTCETLMALRRAETDVTGCNGAGRVDPEELAASVRNDTVLVSVMLANNEVGTVQDVAEVVRLVRRRNPRTLIHSDAVQALGRLPLNVRELDVDLLSMSAHKVYGPKGVGALYVRHGTLLGAQVSGGGQERGRRSGTENVAGIVGFGIATELATARRDVEMPRQRELARRLADMVVAAIPDIVLTGSALHRLANIASFAVPGVPSEVLVTALDGAGICASGGSACSSGAARPSHVLAAMGIAPHVTRGALRLSLGSATTPDNIDTAAKAVVEAVLRARASARI